jgi:hypothetical protein
VKTTNLTTLGLLDFSCRRFSGCPSSYGALDEDVEGRKCKAVDTVHPSRLCLGRVVLGTYVTGDWDFGTLGLWGHSGERRTLADTADESGVTYNLARGFMH